MAEICTAIWSPASTPVVRKLKLRVALVKPAAERLTSRWMDEGLASLLSPSLSSPPVTRIWPLVALLSSLVSGQLVAQSSVPSLLL